MSATRPRSALSSRPRCPSCNGSGYDPLLPPDDDLGAFDCLVCDGTGYDNRMPDKWLPDLIPTQREDNDYGTR